MGAREYLGVDFSGAAAMWSAGTRRSNVWIATLEEAADGPVLRALLSVQELPGDGPPFGRLAALLGARRARAVGIDAPFALPAAQMPDGGLSDLLDRVAALPHDGRPFPGGAALVAAFLPDAGPRGRKLFRACERRWLSHGVNVRSTLWNGPRGGAPMTAACLALLARARPPVWPWAPASAAGLVVEAFPAAQLRRWGVPHQRYAEASALDRANRERIVAAVLARVRAPAALRRRMEAAADPLDAVVCAWIARAVARGEAVDLPSGEAAEEAAREGWIGVGP